MSSNESTIEHLNNLIAGDRIERYHSPNCDLCGPVLTDEAKATVAEIKTRAAGIVLQLSSPDAAPDLWAQLLKATPFDSFDAKVARGEVQRTTEGTDEATKVRIRAFLDMALASEGYFGGPDGRPPLPVEEIEAATQRLRDLRAELARKEPELYKVRAPRHLTNCPNREEQ